MTLHALHARLLAHPTRLALAHRYQIHLTSILILAQVRPLHLLRAETSHARQPPPCQHTPRTHLPHRLLLLQRLLHLTVHHQLAVLHLYRVTSHANASLDVILPPVHWSVHNLAIPLVTPHHAPASFQTPTPHVLALSPCLLNVHARALRQPLASLETQRLIIHSLHRSTHRVTSRKVKHHDVAPLYIPEASQPSALPLHAVPETRNTRPRNRVLHQRQRQRSHRSPRTVTQLAYQQVIAHQQRALHRRRRNLKILKQIQIDEIYRHQREHYRVRPVQHRLQPLVFHPAPTAPRHYARQLHVRHQQQ